jgi:hypothetical protein
MNYYLVTTVRFKRRLFHKRVRYFIVNDQTKDLDVASILPKELRGRCWIGISPLNSYLRENELLEVKI